MFQKKTIRLLERELEKADGKIEELNKAIEYRDKQIVRLVKKIAQMNEEKLALETENKKLWDMYYASEKVRKRLAGERDVEDAVPYITVTVPRGENYGT